MKICNNRHVTGTKICWCGAKADSALNDEPRPLERTKATKRRTTTRGWRRTQRFGIARASQ